MPAAATCSWCVSLQEAHANHAVAWQYFELVYQAQEAIENLQQGPKTSPYYTVRYMPGHSDKVAIVPHTDLVLHGQPERPFYIESLQECLARRHALVTLFGCAYPKQWTAQERTWARTLETEIKQEAAEEDEDEQIRRQLLWEKQRHKRVVQSADKKGGGTISL